MKPYYFLLIALFVSRISYAHILNADTVRKRTAGPTFTSIEKVPEYPGGMEAFAKYISKNLKYPEVARLIGISGRVVVSFVVERDGKVTQVTPLNCIGAGCEAEAAGVLEASKPWTPGIQNSRPVRVQYSVPINFSIEKGKVTMKQLRNSDYGFIFEINNQLYSIDEAELVLGKSFMSADVEIAEPYYNGDNNEKFRMPQKKRYMFCG
ncbi:energy transducer TonB [Mucilaginibacter sp. SP1R1]|uniref:energy transducer TonB n=1 Tax=Mucilaginibacter sp. SP1R1 TaxID=2723091 RepID=UPI003AFFE179